MEETLQKLYRYLVEINEELLPFNKCYSYKTCVGCPFGTKMYKVEGNNLTICRVLDDLETILQENIK